MVQIGIQSSKKTLETSTISSNIYCCTVHQMIDFDSRTNHHTNPNPFSSLNHSDQNTEKSQKIRT